MEELEKKLKEILNNISARLSQGEIPEEDYSRLVSDQLRAQELIKGGSDDVVESVGYFHALLNQKLNVQELVGLRQDYHALETTPLSEEAKKDIERFEELKTSTRNYLKETAGQKPLSREEFSKILHNYVDIKIPDKDRSAEIVGCLSATLEKEVTLREEPCKIGEYNLDTIRETLNKL